MYLVIVYWLLIIELGAGLFNLSPPFEFLGEPTPTGLIRMVFFGEFQRRLGIPKL